MSRGVERLTVKQVENYRKPGMYADGKGLYLDIAAGGSKRWIYRYWRTDKNHLRGGKNHDMQLGSFPDMSLAEAREECGRQRKLRAQGHDPIESRKEKKAMLRAEALNAKTFYQCAVEYLNDQGARMKPVTKRSWEGALQNHVYPKLGNLLLDDITKRHILEVVRPMWHTPRRIAAKGGEPTAYLGYKTLQRIESILDWWLAHGDGTRGNPARWKDNISKILPHPHDIKALEHRAAIPYGDLPAFFTRLQLGAETTEPRAEYLKRNGTPLEVADLALQLTILTCLRAQEACGGKWDEIDWHYPLGPIWTIPASRMKGRNGRKKKKEPHKVPLSLHAVAVLKIAERYKVNEFIFPSGASKKGHVPYQTLLRRAKTHYAGTKWRGNTKLSSIPITTHGMRAAFSTWRAEKTNFPEEVGEAALAHTIPNTTKASYQRGDLLDRRFPLMCAWGDFVTGAEEKGKVVQLRTRA
jgi:integrase